MAGGVALAVLVELIHAPDVNEMDDAEMIAQLEPFVDGEFSPSPDFAPFPQPQPQEGQETTETEDHDDCVPDDFGRQCPKEAMQSVIVVAFSTSGHSLEHASLSVAGRTEGWHFVNPRDVVRVQRRGQYDYIAPGEVRDDFDLFGTVPFFPHTYDACPESTGIVEARIDAYRKNGGTFNLLNVGARNCAGWVCQVLQEAHIQPKPPKKLLYTPSPATCETPGLRPIHLTPGGAMKSFADIPTSLSE